MSETHTSRPDNGSDFSLRSLHAYFTLWITSMEKLNEERSRSQDEKTTLALASSKEAIAKAENATEKRFDAVNEFRGTLSDQASTLLPRAEANTKFTSYDEKIEDLKKEVQGLRESRSGGQGRSDAFQWTIERGLAVVVVLVGAIEFVLRTKP